ncbi:motility associated factor glycosyltransferase family protein [Alkalihalobacterium sp. APHAB7]|uniref:motility associated factor glycosyltransferase family protein n=1 Tax=Alkalihalobacterium sp. APHAB7 TaxID=3402081 RepID=UPI003AB04895
MLLNNNNFLGKNYSWILDLIRKDNEEFKNDPIDVIETKTTFPTLKVTVNNRPLFIHSKYDPIKEAEKLVEQYVETIANYEHVFFYGVGFGYHVESFLARWPNKSFTLYEPEPAVFKEFVHQRDLNDLPLKQMKNLFVEWDQESSMKFINQFALELREKVLLIILPSYERIFPEKLEQFLTLFKNNVQQRSYSVNAEAAFSKRWTLNSLMNLPSTLQAPNLLEDKKLVFKNKPVLIVSAGPSLQEEYENLKKIKDKGLAYILAVGSANKALIANNIIPDAVCTYDPQGHNYKVFKNMIENNITSVPMIYGTSVGFETIEKYKGPKLHVVTSQDRVTPFFNEVSNNTVEQVDDAFSIAIVTLQILAKLNAGLIILVGQNFAFKENLYYSKDINRGKKSAEIQEKDLFNTLYVEDVYGNEIKTNQAFNQMRLLMEDYIRSYEHIEVVNTTNGGAKINGAPFIDLEELINNRLWSRVVEPDWHANKRISNQDIGKKTRAMLRMKNEFVLNYSDIFDILIEMNAAINSKALTTLENIFTKFDQAFHRFFNNKFYQSHILPITNFDYETLSNRNRIIINTRDVLEKAQLILKDYGNYMTKCKEVYNELSPLVDRVIQSLPQENNKIYQSDCGSFFYSNQWQKRFFEFKEKDRTINNLSYFYADKKGAKIKFNFFGSSIQLLAGKSHDLARSVKVIIDGKSEMFSTRDSKHSKHFILKIDQVVFEKHNLNNKLHEVEIELLEDCPFIFNGVQVNKQGRLLHVDEVTSIEELDIGKRIRCHYKADYNTVGQFSGIGDETKGFIPPESSSHPDGDFYFIMVDVEDGRKLIADRNVQTKLSWIRLKQFSTEYVFSFNESVEVNEYLQFSLVTGGSSIMDKYNDWDMYIGSHQFKEKNIVWNTEYMFSWTATQSLEKKGHRVFRGKICTTKWSDSSNWNSENSFNVNKVYNIGLRPVLFQIQK